MIDYDTKVDCPHCGRENYLWFVRANHYCQFCVTAIQDHYLPEIQEEEKN